ncbi:MAG: hypothetical protein K2X52_10950 [Mycobacteriaceae bacterium]|nr:hypothetical protein [Mycobacteriaceae bacterium]
MNAELLGAPSEDWKLFSGWADDFFKLFSWNVAEHENAILRAWAELDDYIDAMVAERRESLSVRCGWRSRTSTSPACQSRQAP